MNTQLMNAKITSLLLLGILTSTSSHAQTIFAGFDQSTDFSTYGISGNGDTSVVDAWRGMAGNGWSNEWQVENGSLPTSVEFQTINGASPSGNTENYEQTRLSSTNDTNSRQVFLTRSFEDYGSVDLSKEITFSFYYRVDDLSAFAAGGSTYIEIKEGGTRFNQPNGSWVMRSYGNAPTWWAHDGDGSGNLPFNGNTGMAVVEGDNYFFTITADPTTALWSVTIDNLDDSSGTVNDTVTLTDLGFVGTNGGTFEGKFLTGAAIAGPASGTYNLYHSIDNISIVPEPSSVALLSGVAALALFRASRRKM